ncbi:MAG: GntR family transcriptional regulator [Nocardioidaceae bacterium]
MSRLTDHVVARLRQDIVAGRFPPGGRLTEMGLCEAYGVSRVPVREALKALEVEGFLTYRAYAGVTVATTSSGDAEDLYAVRKAIEVRTVRRCAGRFGDDGDEDTADFAERLTALVEAGSAAVDEADPGRLAQLNTEFHLSLAEFSESDNLQSLLRQVALKIEWLYAMDVKSRAVHSWAEHRQIAGAVIAGDPDRCEELIAQHIQNSLDGYQARHATG